ncbi:hypothetical protein V7S43_005196 [Phytophthora oleae]|uniref:Uncharacterized protein n=1 Tax=Phytophthora oleae TaxID=2107226 RepID=A0ABD3FW40_9STRA
MSLPSSCMLLIAKEKMPRKNRLRAQIARLALARRARHERIRLSRLGERVGEANGQDFLSDDTSSESNDEEPDVGLIFAKKTNTRDDAFYLVGRVGSQLLYTWLQAADIPQDKISEFELAEVGTSWPVDYREIIPTGVPAGIPGRGIRAIRRLR